LLLDRFYQICPKCGRKSRRLVLVKKLRDRTPFESVRRTYAHGGDFVVEEPFSVWVYIYDVSRRCRLCQHQWTEKVTVQRPW